MPKPNPRPEPFVGYRVTLAPEADSSIQPRLVSQHAALRALVAGQRSVTLAPGEAATLYDSIEQVPEHLGAAFPLRFTSVRCRRGRALPFETVALSTDEILHLVHDGLFGSACCREAAIGAVQACGVLPVPALALPPLPRHSARATAERHVDTLIDHEPELHLRQGAESAGSAT
jgi:hypothetical protein